MVGISKFKVHESFLFTEEIHCIENKEHLIDFVITCIVQPLCFNALPSGKVSQSTLIVKSNECIAGN